MQFNGYPSCCGAAILHDFGFYDQGEPTPKDLERLDLNIKDRLKLSYAFWSCILTGHQNDVLGHVFEANGFMVVDKRKNPNSGNMVFFYSLTKPEPKVAKKGSANTLGVIAVPPPVATAPVRRRIPHPVYGW